MKYRSPVGRKEGLMKRKPTKLIAWIVFGCLVANLAYSQEQANSNFGGPDTAENRLAAEFDSWDEWKKKLQTDHGFGFGVDYTGVFLSASEALDSDTASGGILRAYGAWELTDNGAFVWKFEHRHKYGSLSPFDFSLGSLGYVGLHEPPFNNSKFRTQNLFWRQRFGGGRSALVAGVLDPTDFLDLYGLISPWLHFMNFAFSTGSATIGLPNDAAVGVGYGTMLTDNYYLIASLTDTNGDPSDPLKGFGNFFNDNEYFSSVEFGWTTADEAIYLDNYHVTVWHKDRQVEANVNGGWGVNFSFARFVDQQWMPFLRGGYANDGGSLLQKSLSGGIGWKTVAFDGLLGAGVNWGQPNEETFLPGLDDQYAIEVFYRVPILQKFAVTVDTQLIRNPALNPDASTIWMFNLRARGAF